MRRVTFLDSIVIAFSTALCVTLILLQLRVSQPSVYSGSIFYLTPATERLNNIWMMPDTPSETRQVTFSTLGIQSFTLSPDGKWLVYSEYQDASRNTHLILQNMMTGVTEPLTTCTDSSCENPVFSPDSRTVAYERIALNSNLPGVPASPPRVWLVNMSTSQRTERPLEPDAQSLSMMPLWAPDGRHIAVWDRSVGDIRLYDMGTGTSSRIARPYGTTGSFTPDSQALLFPAPIEVGGEALTLKRFHLSDQTLETLNIDIPDFRPTAVTYSPNGQFLAGLHLSDEADCYSGAALFIGHLTSSDTLETLSSTHYCANNLSWDAIGERLFVQRVSIDEAGSGTPEIWVYDLSQHTANLLITNAYHARWVP